ncbi:hypothetical protein AB0E62_36555 [Streptomyces sp. NPDC038707]|uniref:hypothetical protein n=1 Tax=Streptomyces sp. NPDC038707 TaxID=3154329 RepID=UPI0033D13813
MPNGMQRRQVRKVVSDAHFARRRGDISFEAVIDIKVRARPSRRKLRAAVDELVGAVEAVGRQCVCVQPFLASVETTFVRVP